MTERPTNVFDKIRRAMSRDAKLPLARLAEKGLRFGVAMVTAPAYLRDCDAVGARVRTMGRPIVQNLGHIEIGADAIINSHPAPVRLVTTPRGRIRVGSHFIFNFGAALESDASVELGDRVTMGPFSSACDFEGEPVGRPAPVVLEDDVWLTIRARVGRGVRIGAGTIVTAGSLVLEDLPGGVIAGGVPARVIRPRRKGDRAEVAHARTGHSGRSALHRLVRQGGRSLDPAMARARLAGATQVGDSPWIRGSVMVQNLGMLTIGDRFRLLSTPEPSHLVTGVGARIAIGDDVSIGAGAAITAEERVTIGDRVTLDDGVMIMDTNFHGTDDFMAASETAPVTIGDGAWIGSGVTILKGSRIGAGARVLPDSVVAGEIPAGATAGGVLAKVIAASG
jgi:acetyltransferase-like isoleucine patch superfamily enzyme